MKEFKYVFVPCDVDAPIEELTMQYSSSTEVNCCTEKFKKHFQSATKSMSSEQKTQFLAEVMKNAQKDHKNFDPQNVSEEMLNSLTSMQMVDIVSLSTPKKASGFVSVCKSHFDLAMPALSCVSRNTGRSLFSLVKQPTIYVCIYVCD